MFTHRTPAPIRPSGELVHASITTGNTVRYRNGLTVEVYRAATFRLFVGGVFVAGWNDVAPALAYADKL